MQGSGLLARSPERAWGGLGPVGQVLRGLGARAPRAGARPTRHLSNYDFSQTSGWEPGEGVGVG